MKLISSIVVLCFALFNTLAYADAVDDLLKEYQGAGAGKFVVSEGERIWKEPHPDPKEPGKTRSCSTCHGDNLRIQGKHASTGKVIEPMAPSVNKDRLTDPKFIEKWFTRNCKWVLGRACTSQEKGDILTYLQTQ